MGTHSCDISDLTQAKNSILEIRVTLLVPAAVSLLCDTRYRRNFLTSMELVTLGNTVLATEREKECF